MGDIVEEIVAEPEDPGFVEKIQFFFLFVNYFVRSYAWYIVLGAGAAYYLWKKSQGANNQGPKPKTADELKSWQSKEEQRLKAIQRLQEKYEEDARIKEEKQKQRDEEKRKARLAELEALEKEAGGSGQKLGESSKKSFKPEYNPLMGDSGDSNRVCFRRPGGGAGGGG